jgi:bifunctional DNA-binding transcriptional regulator/antitoxin component of YhaV-PrlF toxin-antitoxin module
MRASAKGQVTIPIEIRERLGLLLDTEVAFTVEGSTVRLVKVPARTSSRVVNWRSADCGAVQT